MSINKPDPLDECLRRHVGPRLSPQDWYRPRRDNAVREHIRAILAQLRNRR